MKKNNIFRHELNESIQANAALNCLNNRNKHKQINEVAPVVAAAGRMLLPMLRPVITKLVQKALVKIGAHARPTQVITHVMGMLSKGEFAKKMAEKCGQTWNEIPSDVKKEIQDAIIAAFKKQSTQEQEENVDYVQLADDVCASYRGPLSKLDLKDSINYIVKMVAKKIGKTVDTLTPEELTAIQKAAKYSVWYVSEQEEDTLNAYYSQDEPDYENDHHGIWLIINLMRKQGMLRAQGIEGRDNVDDGNAIDKAYDLIEQKLNEEGMWIGDDDHEAERFVSFFGDEIAAEAMKSAIHNQEQEESFDDAEDFISNVVNLMEDEGMIDESQWDSAYYTVEEMIQSNPKLKQYPSYMQFLNVFADDILSSLNNQEQEELPNMERHDIILALTQYLDECWIDADEDGDLDELYYAVVKVLDKTGDYPASTNWEDCKPWCQKHYREVEETFLGGGF